MHVFNQCQHMPAQQPLAHLPRPPTGLRHNKHPLRCSGFPSAGGSSSTNTGSCSSLRLLTCHQHSTQCALATVAHAMYHSSATAAAVAAATAPTNFGSQSTGWVPSSRAGPLRWRQRGVVAAAAAPGGKGGSSREDEIWQQLTQMADKYLFTSGKSVVSAGLWAGGGGGAAAGPGAGKGGSSRDDKI